MAIFVMQLRHGHHMHLALAVHGTCLDHDLFRLATMRTAIHAERAADASRNAAIEGEA